MNGGFANGCHVGRAKLLCENVLNVFDVDGDNTLLLGRLVGKKNGRDRSDECCVNYSICLLRMCVTENEHDCPKCKLFLWCNELYAIFMCAHFAHDARDREFTICMLNNKSVRKTYKGLTQSKYRRGLSQASPTAT